MVLPRRQQVSAHHAGNADCFLRKSSSSRLYRRQQNHHDDGPSWPSHDVFLSATPDLHIQLASGEPMISLEIFIARLARHLCRKCWSWRLLIPAEFLEVITNVLLVKRFLRAPGLVLVRRPEAGRIWRQNFISQSNSLRRSPELELRIRNDDAPPPRIIRSLVVTLQAQISQFPAEFRTHQLRHLLERNILVMARDCLGRRSEDRFRKLIGFSKAARKMNAAN